MAFGLIRAESAKDIGVAGQQTPERDAIDDRLRGSLSGVGEERMRCVRIAGPVALAPRNGGLLLAT